MSTETQQEYRTLEPHETIEPGDEFKSVGDAWVPVHTSSWHTPAFMGNEYRRPIKPEPPMKSGYMFEQAQAATRCLALVIRAESESDGVPALVQFCGERCEKSSRKGEALLAEIKRLKDEADGWPDKRYEQLQTQRAEIDRLRAEVKEFGEWKGQLDAYKDQWKRHYESKVRDFEQEKQNWFHKHLNEEADDLRELIAECERLRQEAVQSEGRAITSRDEYLRQSSFYLQKWNMDAKEKVHYHDKLAVAVEHIQEMEAERDRLAAENSKLLSLIKGCASHFEDLSSVSWSVGSDFSEGSYRELAAEVLKAALAQPEGGK